MKSEDSRVSVGLTMKGTDDVNSRSWEVVCWALSLGRDEEDAKRMEGIVNRPAWLRKRTLASAGSLYTQEHPSMIVPDVADAATESGNSLTHDQAGYRYGYTQPETKNTAMPC